MSLSRARKSSRHYCGVRGLSMPILRWSLSDAPAGREELRGQSSTGLQAIPHPDESSERSEGCGSVFMRERPESFLGVLRIDVRRSGSSRCSFVEGSCSEDGPQDGYI